MHEETSNGSPLATSAREAPSEAPLVQGAPHAERADESGLLAALLSQRVRALRHRLELTRAQLSERSDVSIAYLARLEAGHANVSLQVLEQIAEALAVPPHELIDPLADPGSDLHALGALLRAQPAHVHSELLHTLGKRFSAAPSTAVPHTRIALIGLRGAGKSTLGKALAARLELPFVEINREIEREGGLAVAEVFTLYGAAGYRRLERSCLRRVIERHAAVVVATGGGLVTDPDTFRLLRESCRTVWLHAQPEDHFERVRRQQDSRIAAPSLREIAMANIRAMLTAREPLYAQADVSLDTSGRSVTESLEELRALVTMQHESSP